MDSCVVPHRSTNRAALWLTAQIGRDAVLSESYGRRQQLDTGEPYEGPGTRWLSGDRSCPSTFARFRGLATALEDLERLSDLSWITL